MTISFSLDLVRCWLTAADWLQAAEVSVFSPLVPWSLCCFFISPPKISIRLLEIWSFLFSFHIPEKLLVWLSPVRTSWTSPELLL